MWAHVWAEDEEKKYIGSFKLTEIEDNVISLEDKGEFGYHQDNGDYWSDNEGKNYMMTFGGSPEEDAHDSFIGEQGDAGYQLPPWYTPQAAGDTGGKN